MQGVSIRVTAVLVLATSGLAIALLAQNSGGSALVVRVNPEAHLDTPVAQLSFNVNTPGQIIMSQPVTITAWVRSLPGQQIRLTAQPAALRGPTGAVPVGALRALRWSGSMTNATGGATAAVCTSGDFGTGGPQPLIGNWTQSGIAKCTVTFALATDESWPAGTYSGEIDLSLLAQ